MASMASCILWPRLVHFGTNKLILSTATNSIFIQSSLCRKTNGHSKSIKFRTAYGDAPILSDEEYNLAKDENQLDDLSFKSFRFAKIDENNSPLYDHTYELFLRNAMRNGKRSVIEGLMDETFYLMKTYQLRKQKKQEKARAAGDTKELASYGEDEETIVDPMELFKRALENCKPLLITKKIRRGGAIYQVPFPLDPKQSEWYSYKWLIATVLDRPRPRKKKFYEAMSQELLDAAYNRGKVIKKRDDVHKLAETNKAYSHYRWG